MVKLTEDEIEWLNVNQPEMEYDRERSVIKGPFSLCHRFNDITLKATFLIEVRLWMMQNRHEYPLVYNPDGQIQKIAQRKNLPLEDLHIYKNNCLCLGLPQRFKEYYPNGFEVERFFDHLTEHLYWVAYFERYNKEPWKAERHGDDALVEYYIENNDIEGLRSLYRKYLKRGIAKQKLRNYLASEELTRKLKKKLYQL